MSFSCTAVLVLYELHLSESTCFQSLREALTGDASIGDVRLLIYDNSPHAQNVEALAGEFIYRHDSSNGGVAAAYNAGLQQARENGSEWLLLLDQDTAITQDYLAELRERTASVPAEVVAIIPRLTQDGETHSPQTLPRLSHRPLPESRTGLLDVKVSIFNSGAAVRVAAVQRFPERYWLDFLDHAIFHELQAAGGRIWLMQTRLEHRLSTQRLGEDASLGRYLNVLQAERDFYSQYGSLADVAFYRLRRAKQTAGQLIKVRDKSFALLSARAALGLLPPTPLRQSRAT